MPLLNAYRTFIVFLGLCIDVTCVSGLVLTYGVTEVMYKLLILSLVFILSVATLLGCNQGIRIEPIQAIVGEHSDQQLLEALFEKAIKPEEVEQLQTIPFSALPLTNYLFVGNNCIESRNKILSGFITLYPDLIFVDAISETDKTAVALEIQERRNNKGESTTRPPYVILTENFQPAMLQLANLKIFVFIATKENFNIPVPFKIVEKEIVQILDPKSKVTFGFYDTMKQKLFQILM